MTSVPSQSLRTWPTVVPGGCSSVPSLNSSKLPLTLYSGSLVVSDLDFVTPAGDSRHGGRSLHPKEQGKQTQTVVLAR